MNTTQKQDEQILKLITALNDLRDALSEDLKTSEIQYVDDLYDTIMVAYFKKQPDGTHQEWVYDNIQKGRMNYMTYEQAKNEILVRLNNTFSELYV